MSRHRPSREIRRIGLVVDVVTAPPEVIEAAVELAARMHAQLRALLIEDETLLRVVNYPHALQISLRNGRAAPIDRATVEQDLRAIVFQAERALVAVARRSQVPYAVRVVRGTLAAQLRDAAGTDLVLLDRSAVPTLARAGVELIEIVRRSRQPLLLLRGELGLRRGPVTAVLADDSPLERVLGVATQFASRLTADMAVLLAARDDASRQAARKHAQAWLERRGWKAGFQSIAGVDADLIGAALTHLRSGLLVVGCGDLAVGDLEGISVPLCLVY